MAGRRIVRRSDLVYVGTTSLYGIRPNQYDRATVPNEILGGHGPGNFGFRFLGSTQGYGTSQFSEATKDAVERLTAMSRNGKGVNNVFGEGANPRLRAIRDGIVNLGLTEDLLVHGMSKSVYGVSMLSSDNLSDYLLGLTSKPRYVFPRNATRDDVNAIAGYWIARWVVPRLNRADTLERVRNHTLIYPIRHGARLTLPDADVDQLGMFAETSNTDHLI
jgi:hypothetical protein